MAQFLAPILNDQQEDANGAPLSGGTVEVYLAGTSTPATTFSDKAGLVPNTWPIVLNTLGVNNQGAVWLTGGSAYKFIIKDATFVVQRTIDNVSGINDNTVAVDQWIVYQGAPTYLTATSFTVAGDQTQIFQVGRRVKTTNTGGTVYSSITGSTYAAPNTTITLSNDSGSLDAGLSAVSYGVISSVESSLPGAFRSGQCRLVKVATNLVLQPFQGNQITINGAAIRIPSAGVSLAPTGLTPNTLYYIYAFLNAGVLTLEASTTAHATDSATGMEIKTGDPARTLVGMARPITGPAWQDAVNQRLVISWFNRRSLSMLAPLVATTNNTSTGAYAVLSSTLLLEFLSWGDSSVRSDFQGTLTNNTTNAISNTAAFLDGANSDSLNASGAYAISASQPVSCSLTATPAEGYHSFQVYASQNVASAASYAGGGTPGQRCVHSAVIQG